MNLNKYINVLLVELSKKYDISIMEISSVFDNRVYRKYTVSYSKKDNDDVIKEREQFSGKRALVSWLMWLNKN